MHNISQIMRCDNHVNSSLNFLIQLYSNNKKQDFYGPAQCASDISFIFETKRITLPENQLGIEKSN